MRRKLLAMGLFTLAIGLSGGLASTSFAQAVPPGDALTDPAMKGPEVIAFIGLKHGSKVADIVAGRFVRAFSEAVGPTGKVYAVEPAEVIKAHPEVLKLMQGLASMPAYSNVVLITDPINAMALPTKLDAVFIRQNYHDLYDKFMGPADVALFNKHVFEALKPGGVYVVLDHADVHGAGRSHTNTTHRIDIMAVKEDLAAAGFKFVSESKVLANPDDDHTKFVFNPAVRGKTDQFLLKFKKPGKG